MKPINLFINEMKDLFKCKNVYFMNGSENETKELLDIAQRSVFDDKVILKKLNHNEYPNSYYHRSNINDVARTEHLTYVCTKNIEQAGPNNNWMEPNEAKKKMLKLFSNSMNNRTMYVIPFTMGMYESEYAKDCIQITDSVYVALSMKIMTRVGNKTIDRIGDSSNFFRGIHSVGTLNPSERYIMHFPEENLVMSFGSGYGGNALLGKKSYALRIGSYLGYKEGWLAEHMFIIGVESPNGKITYFLGAFPSACGKTNVAMLKFVFKGYKVWTLGDDIAWLNVGKDGNLYAINPETGFFGVAPGINYKTNQIIMETLKNNKFLPTLFTNTAIDNDNNVPWWEGLSDKIPLNLTDWKGEKYFKDSNKTAAHPNSRFTVSIYNCPTLSKEYYNPKGVPISGIIFGGRRKDTIPLVFETNDWNNGVFMASTVGSEITAASSGDIGNVRRDPMAMLPFCGYNMGDYFQHWLNIGNKIKNKPKIFIVNWFRKDENGKHMWPGFGDNSRIIKWMIDRIDGNVDVKKSEIGLLPNILDLNLDGLEIGKNILEKLFSIDRQSWIKEISMIEEFYSKFGNKIPKELQANLLKLKNKIQN
ncbi:MAG: phosphoenolpyruvate carboxykinase (GTP) [Endomicrobium sp.]|jgi:phosphoenolpyruvate carboxykinase (GTP)|nr:phosphoenolpyruvate carboxykinase (GTP) [Endomicrobium sp.]